MSERDNIPREPSADARQSARALRDQFLALIAEDFTEDQALTIIGHMLRGAGGGS